MSNIIKEDVLGKVKLVKKRGREGSYDEKAIEHDGKVWVISKKNKDSVEVGNSYHFSLSKSEYNDKLYYWANLVDSKDKGTKEQSSPSGGDIKKEAFNWMNGLSVEEKKKIIIYLLGKI